MERDEIVNFQDFFCVSGTYPVDERCSEMTLVFWGTFMVGVCACVCK